jgi:Tol biopolymer transport system component
LPAGARIVELAAARNVYAATVEWGSGTAGTLKNGLYLIRAGSARLLVPGADAYSERPHPVFSPDGSRIAYEHGGDIWVVTTKGARTRISRTAKAAETGACWSPDGTRLAYTSGRNGVNEAYAATLNGHETRLTHTRPHGADVPQVGTVAGAWSPDGSEVAVVTYNAIGVVPATGGPTTIIRTFTPAASAHLGPVWW